MRPTYADILVVTAAARRSDRAARMPLLGLLTGFTLAFVLWSAIGWAVWALVA